jgi:hypothetical protein
MLNGQKVLKDGSISSAKNTSRLNTLFVPKMKSILSAVPIHRNERLLVICYKEQWKELKYIKSRQSIYEEEENCWRLLAKH